VSELTVAKIRECLRILKEADDREEARLDEAYWRWKRTGECDHPRWQMAMPPVCAICGKESR